MTQEEVINWIPQKEKMEFTEKDMLDIVHFFSEMVFDSTTDFYTQIKDFIESTSEYNKNR